MIVKGLSHYFWYDCPTQPDIFRGEYLNRGVLYAIGAYLIWGFLPIYWKTLKQVPPLEILTLTGILGPHRMELWAEDSHESRSEKVEFIITLVP